MTKEQFNKEIFDFWTLQGFCIEEDCDICDHVFKGETAQAYILEEIQEMITANKPWFDIRDMLVKSSGGKSSEYYLQLGFLWYIPASEWDFTRLKTKVLEWAIENNLVN